MTIEVKKILIIAAIALTVIAVILLSVLLPIFLPRNGAERTEIWSDQDQLTREDFIEVQMPTDGSEFRLMHLTDVQITNSGALTNESFEDITKLVETQKPHLIVLTGDNVQGHYNDKMTRKLVQLLETFKTPWTLTYGNHDVEGRADQAYLSEIIIEEGAEYGLFATGPSNIKGFGNHVVNVVNGDEIVYSLQLIDSNSRYVNAAGESKYDYIGEDQIAYFEYMHAQAETVYSSDVKSMAFYHIAPVELNELYTELMERYQPEYDGNGKAPVLSATDIPEILFGEFREGVYSSDYNSGIVNSGLITNTSHAFIGHDHINNSSVMIGEQQITYGMKLGAGSYHDDDLQGGTMIYISADKSVKVEHKFMSDLV